MHAIKVVKQEMNDGITASVESPYFGIEQVIIANVPK